MNDFLWYHCRHFRLTVPGFQQCMYSNRAPERFVESRQIQILNRTARHTECRAPSCNALLRPSSKIAIEGGCGKNCRSQSLRTRPLSLIAVHTQHCKLMKSVPRKKKQCAITQHNYELQCSAVRYLSELERRHGSFNQEAWVALDFTGCCHSIARPAVALRRRTSTFHISDARILRSCR